MPETCWKQQKTKERERNTVTFKLLEVLIHKSVQLQPVLLSNALAA